jgi:hypothetical protein
MTQSTIQESILQLVNSALQSSAGAFSHTGDYNITGKLTADTISVKNLLTENGNLANPGQWLVQFEEDLNGKGFSWAWGDGGVNLQYRAGNRLWSSGSFDIPTDQSYRIDNVPVISATELGSQIVKSKLREVGILKNLHVAGNATVSDFAVFNSALGRLGLGTEEPNAVLSVSDNGVEIIAGASGDGAGVIGTYTSDHLEIVTDNTARIVIKNSGEVIFGNETTKTANITIHGTLKVDNLVSDTRIDRYSSLEFKATKDQSEFGQGLIWTGNNSSKSLMLRADPNRIWTSESIEIAHDQSYYIDGEIVLSKSELGSNVVSSNLSKLGTLSELAVQGGTIFFGDVNATFQPIRAKSIVFDENNSVFTITNSNLDVNNQISITVNRDEVIYADQNQITLGNKSNTRRPVKVFGPLSVGVNNPDPDVEFSVNGNVSIGGKKFVTGSSAPTSGTFAKGDICWNESPTEGNYIGWVYIGAGNWLPFGAIASQ